jgi:hypothetical protein
MVVGAEEGLVSFCATVSVPPGPVPPPGWEPTVGGSAVTAGVTVTLSVAVAVPSLTRRVKVALVAPVAATISAVIVPLELAMFEIVTPFAGLAVVTVTIRLPADVSASLTVAIVELLPVLPATRATPLAAVIVGIALTVSEIVASVVAPQLSVARIVIVCVPAGAAPEIETTPDELTVTVPVEVPGLCTAIVLIVPLSLGPVMGLIVAVPPTLTDVAA